MKAFIVDRYKGKLRFGDTPDPELRDHDVLVEIYAAGVNPLDSKIRDGEFKLILPYRLPLISTGRRGLCAAEPGPDRDVCGIHRHE